MTAQDVTDVLELLDHRGIAVWIDGGWAVDALVGEQTRQHGDLDVVVEESDLEAAREGLRAKGFRVVDGGEPWNFVMSDGRREVDFHIVRFDAQGNARYGPNGSMYPAGSLNGLGRIAGRRVRCVSPESLMSSYTGYEPDENDFHDVQLLHRRFNIPLPTTYRDAVET